MIFVDMPVGVQAIGGRCPCCCSSSTSCGRPCDSAVTGFCSWIPWCSSGMVVDTPVGVQTTGFGSDSAENCGFRRCSALTRLDVPVIMQRRDVSQPEVPQIQSSPESADISVASETSLLSAWMAALKGLFADFQHFSCSSGFSPGVERHAN